MSHRIPIVGILFAGVLGGGCGDDGGTSPFVRVTAPNGGETWYFQGDDRDITWESSGVGDTVDIQYYDGTSWNFEASGVSNTGSYTWQMPDVASPACLVRVTEAGGGALQDESDAAFTIAPASVTVDSPAAAAEWPRGGPQRIEWTAVGLTNVGIEVSTDNGATYQDVVASTDASAGSYDWDVTGVAGSTQAVMRVSDANDPAPPPDRTPSATSGAFSIQTIEVTSPNGGEHWFHQGTDEKITWSRVGLLGDDYVDLHYSTDGTIWNEIALAEWNDGTYSWTIPNTFSSTVLVRVRQAGGTGTEDVSDAPFSIAQGTVALVNPTTTVTWVEWFDYDIQWTALGSTANVDILGSWDSGTTWDPIPGGSGLDASSGLFTWNLCRPAGEGYSVKIRVADSAEPSNADTSETVLIDPITGSGPREQAPGEDDTPVSEPIVTAVFPSAVTGASSLPPRF